MKAAVVLFFALLTIPIARGARTPDWLAPLLAEKSAAWAPGANLVRLLDYERVEFGSEGRCRCTIRIADRALTRAGQAAVKAGKLWNPDASRIVSARAWIVSANGREVRAYGMQDFQERTAVVEDLVWDQVRSATFVRPELVEVGDVLAWEIVEDVNEGALDQAWRFMGSVPVQHGVFEAVPRDGTKLEWFAGSARVPAPGPLAQPGGLAWRMDRIAAPADGQPQGFMLNPLEVFVRCVAENGSGPTWASLSGEIAGVIEPRIVLSPEVRAEAADIVRGRTTRWDRVRAVAEFVQKNVSYLSVELDHDSMAGYRPHTPDETLRSRYGDCKDKAALTVALLRAAGDEARLVTVSYRNSKAVLPAWPALGRFNHVIVALPADADVPSSWPVAEAGGLGRMVLFDPTDPSVPLGALPQGDQGGYGLVVAAGQKSLVKLPLEDSGQVAETRAVFATLAASGAVEARVEEHLCGAQAASLGWTLEHLDRAAAGKLIEAGLHNSLTTVSGMSWTEARGAGGRDLDVKISFRAERFGRRLSGGRMQVYPELLDGLTLLPAWKTPDDGTVWMPSRMVSSESRMTLPEGFSADDLPDDASESGNGFSFSVRCRAEGRDIVSTIRIAQSAGFLDRSQYAARQALYRQAYEALRQPVGLKAKAGP